MAAVNLLLLVSAVLHRATEDVGRLAFGRLSRAPLSGSIAAPIVSARMTLFRGSQNDLQDAVDIVLIREGTTYVPAWAGFGMERPAWLYP